MKMSSKVVSLLMATVMLSATMLSTIAEASARTISSPSSASEHITYTGDYYDVLGGLDSLLDRTDGAAVQADLKALIGYSTTKMKISTGETIRGTDSNHPSYSGTGSNSLAAWYKKSDRLENDPNSGVKMFYTNDYYSGSGWNREHLWPQSKSGGLYGKTGGGNDLHHIRPTYGKDNSKHGSYPFGDVECGKTYYCNNDPSTYIIAHIGENNVFDPLDSYKGDIARIYAYMVTHYPSLMKLIDNVLVGGYDTLVEWNAIDPVDGYEINRNNVAFECQGNRNPFIDAPELVDVIWGDGTGSSYGNYVAPEVPEDTDFVDTEEEIDEETDTAEDVVIPDEDDNDILSLKEANEARIGSTVTLRGQVTYIYGENTVILEELDGDEVTSFQIYDKSGVEKGKYELNSIVTVTGITSEYNGVIQIKKPSSVKVFSRDNEPIPAVEVELSDLDDNLTKYIVLRDMTLGAYYAPSITLTDLNGNSIDCYKPAKYPFGVMRGSLVDVYCVAYVHEDVIQLRIANSSDYVLHKHDSTTGTVDATLGDIDANGEITLLDVVALQRYLVNLSGCTVSKRVADVNDDGTLNMRDVVILSQYIADIIDDFSSFSRK